jgi:ElaB/YqjD/DUF883 family membrane-anchored ribosome-binding protein
MNKATDTAVSGFASGRDKLADDIAALAAQAADLFRDTGARRLRLAQEALAQAGDVLRAGTGDALHASRGYVRDNPMVVLAGAAAAGALLAWFLTSRSRDAGS